MKGERRGKRKTKFFRFGHPEPHLILWKDMKRQAQYKKEACLFLLPSRILSYEKIVEGERRDKRKTKSFSGLTIPTFRR